MTDGKSSGKSNGKGNGEPPFPVPDKPHEHSNEISPEDQRRAEEIVQEIKQILENATEMTPEQRAVQKIRLMRYRTELYRLGFQLRFVYNVSLTEDNILVGFKVGILISRLPKPN